MSEFAVTDVERAARAALVRAAEPGTPALAAAVLTYGAAGVLARWAAGEEVPLPAGTPRPQLLDADHALRRRLAGVEGAAEIARGAALGARFCCPGDPEWPAGLADLDEVQREDHAGAPLGLWIRGTGDLAALARGSAAVVGSRAASEYGIAVATELAAGLAEQGRVVVSGAAYGIDSAAHRGALAVDGRTVAVLACGVDVPYPRGHAALLQRVLDGGVVVSECPPGAVPHRVRFLARNRLIAAMTAGTVVVEAAARSGALSTARWAIELSRVVLGVPGPVTSAMSSGVHALIRNREMTLVQGAEDVVADLGPIGEAMGERPQGEPRPVDGLSATAAAVLEAVPARGFIGADEVMIRTGLRLAQCLAALRELDEGGLVRGDGTRWRLGPVAADGACR